MRKLFLFLVMTPFFSIAQSGEKNFIDQNYIEVTGRSEMEVTPDLIYIKIIISEKDKITKTPLAERESAMMSKLKEIGIDITKDLLIKDISSNFKYYLLSKGDILLEKEYQLLVRDGKTTGRVFIELENIGISNVSIEKLDHSKIKQFRKDVKIDAMKAAKEKAEALANAIGQNAGRAIYIQELENNYYGTANATMMLSGKVSGVVSHGTNSVPEMDFEKIKLDYSIICRFELK